MRMEVRNRWIFLAQKRWDWWVVGTAGPGEDDRSLEVRISGASPQWALAIPPWLPAGSGMVAEPMGRQVVKVFSEEGGWVAIGSVVPVTDLHLLRKEEEETHLLPLFSPDGEILKDLPGVPVGRRISHPDAVAISPDGFMILDQKGVLNIYPLASDWEMIPAFLPERSTRWGGLFISMEIHPSRSGESVVMVVRPAYRLCLMDHCGGRPYPAMARMINALRGRRRMGVLQLQVREDGGLEGGKKPLSAFVALAASADIVRKSSARMDIHKIRPAHLEGAP